MSDRTCQVVNAIVESLLLSRLAVVSISNYQLSIEESKEEISGGLISVRTRLKISAHLLIRLVP